MSFIHYLIKQIIHFILHIYWIFPVKKNRITLLNDMSYTYGDSMKYLNQYLRDQKINDYEVIFPVHELAFSVGEGCIAVKKNTLLFFYYILTSSVVITNAGGISYLPFKRGQFAISTWHGGGPYKKTGNALYHNKWYEKEMRMHRKNTKFILSSCKYFTDIEAKAMLFNEAACISSGMPRNDIFFKNDVSIRKRVFDYCSIDLNSKLILFAPTFRTDPKDFTDSKKYHVSDLDMERTIKAIKKRFGDYNWQFGIRLHPKLKDVELDISNVINLTAYPDIQELLYSADVLITDYSSLMWDYSLTKKPCFLYADDIDEYEREHGFYMPSKKWPYPIARNNDEMVNLILTFDYEKYKKDIKLHHEECGSFEEGHACEVTINLIKNAIIK
ncbi:CDP-glycerol--poly(glycerophosphate) glycerophosphotransferase [Treponema brennaborense]|uniref:CDP-glycerol:poly(Glycerophosphate)glycerophosphotransferase n=1 Tax=Treponema brennaborense (strain DSM 12168 / CIP 105900 / DD5/3) TaxID=906968 RepID=F4LPR6_TREBD|nr:CDP-glycerol--poly(glycerophosphate) glycerophosphotransferase [Treponema brennaborense]AEE17062.1 CDP-glycerol:poly(glycerophosphate)glycerophosphotransferase [Treponema brennaborense DSM 12168]